MNFVNNILLGIYGQVAFVGFALCFWDIPQSTKSSSMNMLHALKLMFFWVWDQMCLVIAECVLINGFLK